MSEVIAPIDISTPTGRRIVRELEKHKKWSISIIIPEMRLPIKNYIR